MPVCAPGICRIADRARRARKRSPGGFSGKSAPTSKGIWTSVMRTRTKLKRVELDVIVDRHGFEARLVERHVEDSLLARGRKTPGEIGAEFLDQERDAFGAAPLVSDRIFHRLLERDADALHPHA